MSLNANIRRILTINTGSSSLKVAVYEAGREVTRILSGECERIGRPDGHFRINDARGIEVDGQQRQFSDHAGALSAMLAWLHDYRPDLSFDAVGHRVVHGGIRYREPQRVTPEMVSTLQGLISIAPDHMPQAIQAIKVITTDYPELVQIACFDTAFHRQMPRIAQTYPLPRHFEDDGVIRYGFHGLSYEYILQKLWTTDSSASTGRVIIAHLGSGASMAAVRGGIGIDTTMGFTPDGGLMMGTRSGDLDPGVMMYLLNEQKMTPAALNELVNQQSGLLGVSGTSADMRDLLARQSDDPNAAEAVALFCYQAKKYLGALATVLGGIDTLVFTGGIGERAAPVRRQICDGLEFLGIRLQLDRNDAHGPVISSDDSSVVVYVMKTDEEMIIAQSVCRFIPPAIS